LIGRVADSAHHWYEELPATPSIFYMESSQLPASTMRGFKVNYVELITLLI